MTILDPWQELCTHFPALYSEAIAALDLPIKPIDYIPQILEIYFDDVMVFKQAHQVVTHALFFNASDRPDVISIYGEDELLLVQLMQQLIIDRLPENFVQPHWRIYALR